MRRQNKKSRKLTESVHTLKSNVHRSLFTPLTSVFAKGSSKKEPVDYEGGRQEMNFITFLNTHAGKHRVAGGGLDANAGRVHDLDELAKKLAMATTEAEKQYVYDELPDVVARVGKTYLSPHFRTSIPRTFYRYICGYC